MIGRPAQALGLTVAAAWAAVVLSCASPPAPAPDYFVIRQRGVPVGWLERPSADRRHDGRGPFLVVSCRVRLRRWADGRGVREEEMSLAAARRPGGPAYYLAGRWSGGEFRYRAGGSWHLTVIDEFGNVATKRGTKMPAFVSFLGTPLPLATAPPGPNAAGLELTDGRVTSYRGSPNGRSWSGRGPGGRLCATFDADGALRTYADAAGLTVAPAAGVPRVTGVRHEKPRGLLLPCIFSSRSHGTPVALPLAATLSAAVAPADLGRPGQHFEGEVNGDRLAGTFYLDPAAQPPLEEPEGEFGGSAPGPGLALWGGAELDRLAAWYRARGESARRVNGVGLFAGNLLAPYSWLEVEGRAVAAPGREVPYFRLALAEGDEAASLVNLTITAEPKAAGPGSRAPPGRLAALKDGAELCYEIRRGAARVGEVTACYWAPPKETAAVLLVGEVTGVPLADAAPCGPTPSGIMREMQERPPSPAEIFALGAAVACPAEDDEPPYELCFPVGEAAYARARWEGVRAVAAGPETRRCRLFRLAPRDYAAYYTSDGLLARLAWGRYLIQIKAFPTRKGAGAGGVTPPAAPAAVQSQAEEGGTE
jgi:hypothetical protein